MPRMRLGHACHACSVGTPVVWYQNKAVNAFVQVIYKQGSTGNDLFVIRTGYVRLLRQVRLAT